MLFHGLASREFRSVRDVQTPAVFSSPLPIFGLKRALAGDFR